MTSSIPMTTMAAPMVGSISAALPVSSFAAPSYGTVGTYGTTVGAGFGYPTTIF
eukprot:CAMPEP_0169409382 /NCGR_PEP_ID=MMETSP1017-20121227/59214_1 /TAXON_ID=342587 /ORGANISM="Karlodinium micrum, Strain CCMP2283" /LENGTH=53 /DNA_ID=CAMNT_0009516569 /DNA_START=5 /DNA_END=166 /DNA_ORIENTATION=+